MGVSLEELGALAEKQQGVVEQVNAIVSDLFSRQEGPARAQTNDGCGTGNEDLLNLLRTLLGAEEEASTIPAKDCGEAIEGDKGQQQEGGQEVAMAEAARPGINPPKPDADNGKLEVIDRDTIAAKFYYERGVEQIEKKDFAKAEAYFDKSVASRPSAAAHRLRAAMRLKRGQYDGALHDLGKCIEMEPANASHYITRAVALQLGGKHEESIEDYSVAINLEPESPRVWANRGLAWMRLGRNNRALKDLDKAVELWPEYPEGLYNRGVAKHNLEDYKGAVADYARALEIRPDWEEVRHNLDLALGSMGKELGG